MIGREAAVDHFLLIVTEKAYMNRGLASQDMSVWVEQLRVVAGGEVGFRAQDGRSWRIYRVAGGVEACPVDRFAREASSWVYEMSQFRS